MYCNRRTTAELAPRSVVGVMDTSPTPAAPDAASGLGRRSLLKRAAVGGAVAWATPVVLSSPAFADCGSAVGGVTATNFLVQARVTGQDPDVIRLRPYLDPSCGSACTSPSLTATYRFTQVSGPETLEVRDTSVDIGGALQPPTGFTGRPLYTTPVVGNLTRVESIAILRPVSGVDVQAGTYRVRVDIEFTCNGTPTCSSRVVDLPVPSGRPTNFDVTYPDNEGNSPKGFATSCCAPSPNAITTLPAWC